DFAGVLRAARSIDVVSAAMRERYLRRYGVRAAVVHRGLAPEDVWPAPRFDRAANKFSIAVLGSTYSYRPLVLLGRALYAAASEVAAEPRMSVFGDGRNAARLKHALGGRIDVQIAGHVEERNAVPVLQTAFMLYLNYPFSRLASVLRQTSFP